MTFKKGAFWAQMIPEAPQQFEKREGWLSSDMSFGFAKTKRNKWAATEIATGMLICVHSTRKACAEWIEAHMEEIQAQLQKDKAIAAKATMASFLAE